MELSRVRWLGVGADEVALALAQAGSNGSNLVLRCLSTGSKDSMQQTSEVTAEASWG